MKIYLLVLLTILLSCHSIHSQDTIVPQRNPVLTKKFYIFAGVFAPFRQVKFGFAGSFPMPYNDFIDIDETLNLEGIQATFNTNFYWRFSDKWSLNADYFSLRTRNEFVLPKDIKWDKYILKKGSTVEIGYGASILKTGFARVISRGNKHELKGLIGIYFLGVNGSISGIAFVNDEEVELDRSQISVTLPLPSIGLSYLYAPTRKLSFIVKGEWFGIQIDNLGGSLWNLSPGVQYQFSDRIGAQLNYKYISLDGNVDNLNWNGSFQLQFHGPSIGMTASF